MTALDEQALRAYAAERFTAAETAEQCIEWVRWRESTGHVWRSVEDAVGIYALTKAFGGRRLA